ncbi:MAG: sodium:proton antiporter [Candidatus Marinimicrobia bacterium]|nr:sodium:proton antiporter [Candidatus Neomarinimicrobiota bacterium]
MTVYLLCYILFLVGLYGIITKRDLVRIIISSGIMGYAVNLLIVLFGYKNGSIYPIFVKDVPISPQVMVDPLPQALVLTSIVIELGTTAMLVALAVRLFEKYQTFDITKIRRLSG